MKKKHIMKIQLICLPLAIYVAVMIIFLNVGFLDFEVLKSDHFIIVVLYVIAILLNHKIIGLGLLASSILGTFSEFNISQNEAIDAFDWNIKGTVLMFGTIFSLLAEVYFKSNKASRKVYSTKKTTDRHKKSSGGSNSKKY